MAISFLKNIFARPAPTPEDEAYDAFLAALERSSSRREAAAALGPAPVNPDDEMRVVIVTRADLKMGKGKVAAQAGHAAVSALINGLAQARAYTAAWLAGGQAKVVVKVPGEEELRAVGKAAVEAGLVVSYIQDAGRTQVEPGSTTVMAVGPAPRSLIDTVTGKLQLL